ncbi:gephyrin-like molybdotransferase Glp [Isoptericola dokdonensis]|uniref:Molybdopterin molybdenumtransferase n=1 Tax=Isoptericola dokdonensis DS-3 TaxID=1300344 RepID=A0A161II18_9MICO|nr:gephyrin-like molybdotransferase Glp [Isoptericola dokdonensis]ANC29610.1 Molybdopterin molybdenumtransferase [Isoptericola dokdonensis DS-3]
MAEHAGRRSVREHQEAVRELVDAGLAAVRRTTTVTPAGLLTAASTHGVLAPRTLVVDAVAAVDLPGFDNSQMDGYAVRAADLAPAAHGPVALPVAAPVPAGTTPLPLDPGTAAPVMTGAPIPVGADAVVKIEDADPPAFPDPGASATVRFAAPAAPGTFVRPRGSDAAVGDVVVPAGTPLGPAQLGALVAAGVAEVEVAVAPHVLLVSTGSELVPAGAPLGPAQLHDANGAALSAALAQVGCRVTHRVVPDDPAALRAVLEAAPDDVAFVVTSGGVSAGAYEVVRQTLTDAWFGHVAVQPGGPQGLGTITVGPVEARRAVPLVAFPGNPVSALVSFELFLRPVLAAATGAAPAHRPRGRAPLVDALDSPEHLHQVRRGRLDAAGRVEMVGGPGSHLLAHLAAATLLVHVPPGVAHLPAGAEVDYWEIR